jgi:hypothetical protein
LQERGIVCLIHGKEETALEVAERKMDFGLLTRQGQEAES